MQCVSLQNDGSYQSSTTCDFVVITNDEYLTLSMNGLAEIFTEYFAFDMALFSLISISASVAFVTAHGAGRVVRALGK